MASKAPRAAHQVAILMVNSASSFSSACFAVLTTTSSLDSTMCNGALDDDAIYTKETDFRSIFVTKALPGLQ